MASYCDKCPIITRSPKFVPPRGSKTASIYIVGMCPGSDEIFERKSFVGKAGKLLESAVTEAGFDFENDFRIFNVVNCRTTQPDNPNRNRDPYPEEIGYCKKLVYTDIKSVNPKLILVLGKTAASAFIDIKQYGSVRELIEEKRFMWEGTPLRIGYHPSYLVQSGGMETELYKKYVVFFKQFKEKIPLNYLRESMKTLKVLSPNEFLITKFPQTDLGFDIETTSLESTNISTVICGLGFCDLEGNGYYIYLKNKEDFLKVHKKLSTMIKEKRLYVFNFPFEGTVMASQLQIHPYEWNMLDTRQTALVMGKKGGLKSIASRMGFPNWEESMEAVLEILDVIYKLLIKGKGESKELRALKISWEEFRSYLVKKEGDKETKLLNKAQKEKDLFDKSIEGPYEPLKDNPSSLANSSEEELEKAQPKKSVVEQLDILLKLYEDPNSVLTAEEARDILTDQASLKINRMFFDIVPINITSEYCAFDAYAAIKIHHVLWDKMNKKQKKAVEYFNEHSELAASIEASGVGWNLEEARHLHKFYSEEMVKALKSFITTKKVLNALDLSVHEQIKVNSCIELDELKQYFNPQSTHVTTRDVFNRAMDAPITRKVYLLYSLYTEVSSTLVINFTKLKKAFTHILREPFETENPKKLNDKKRQWIQNCDKEILEMLEVYDLEAKELNKDLDRERDATKYKNNVRPNFKEALYYKEVLKKFDFPSMKEGAVIPLYEAFHKIAGVDIDNKDTWTPEFEILYFFRLYKKITKSFTSYLWGTVGMKGSAYLIKSYHNDLFCPPRINTDWHPIIKETCGIDKRIPIVSWKFNINGAETNRWRSGYHLWPWQCELQDLKVSRFENGLLAHCDYSQMEVRVIAALSKEETLLEAYRQGKDIHRYMASKIFNKPEEKITDSERRYSKTLTFSVIYGKGVIAIARDSLQGDIKKAEDLYNGFFNGFPGIDRFKNLGHKQIEEGQGEDDYYVESLLGEKIPLIGNKHGQNTSINQLKRLVVNYPVQSTASHLTAIGINRVNRDAYEHKLPIRAFGFTHDAGDFDFMTEYLFKFIDLLIFHMQDNIANEFNIPVKIDMEIGKTGNCMLELKIKEKTEEKLVVKFGGSKQALDDVTGQFNKANMTYELLNVESKESYVSWDGLFSPKRAYSQNMGKTVEHVEGEMVIFKN